MVGVFTKFAKTVVTILLLCTVLFSVCNGSTIRTSPLREHLAKTYCSYIGVTEATGHNDGRQVNQFQAATGNHTGDAWCASFVAYCLNKCGIQRIGNGMARSWFNKDHITWRRDVNGLKKFSAQRGDNGGLYFPAHKSIAHIFFIHDIKDDKVITVEGNTNNQLSREGNGCWQCIRKIKTIYAVSNWIDK